MKTLPLVAEVLMPETARQDRFQKRRLYQEQRVETLWLVDLEKRYVELWDPKRRFPLIERDHLTWHPTGAAEPLIIPLSTLFA